MDGKRVSQDRRAYLLAAGRRRVARVIARALPALGLLVAVGAITAAGAQAVAPEFGRCVKAPSTEKGGKIIFHGGYTNATCTRRSAAHTGKYEWEPGVVKGGFSIASLESHAITLEGASAVEAGRKIVCKSESGTGSITGAKTVGGVKLKLTGCETSKGAKCTGEGLAEGEVETASLEGELGKVSKTEIGLALYPVGKTGAFASLHCDGVTGLTGVVIAKVVSTNAMLTSSLLVFKAVGGVQEPTHFAGGPKQVLSFLEGGTEPGEQVGLNLETNWSFEERVEINAVA